MSNLDKAESSRRNGAKSRGPVTPSGRERSSQNALKHGLYSDRVLALSTEQQEELEALRQDYFAEWQPETQSEIDTLEKLVAAEWRFLRFSAMENWLVEDMMSQMRQDMVNLFETPPQLDLRAALAYDRLYKESPTLEKFQRERHRLSRMIDRLTRLLQDLRNQNPPAPAADTENTRNEPEDRGLAPFNDPDCSPNSLIPNETALSPNPKMEHRPTRALIRAPWLPTAPIRKIPTPEPPEVVLALAG